MRTGARNSKKVFTSLFYSARTSYSLALFCLLPFPLALAKIKAVLRVLTNFCGPKVSRVYFYFYRRGVYLSLIITSYGEFVHKILFFHPRSSFLPGV